MKVRAAHREEVEDAKKFTETLGSSKFLTESGFKEMTSNLQELRKNPTHTVSKADSMDLLTQNKFQQSQMILTQ